MIMPSRYTALCHIYISTKYFFCDSMQCAYCLIQVHQRFVCLHNAFNNSLNLDNFHWDCKDYTELFNIFNTNDNNSSNVALDTEHCSSFHNGKVDPDINFTNTYNTNTQYFAIDQFANTVHGIKWISIIHINCISLYASKKINITRLFRICV